METEQLRNQIATSLGLAKHDEYDKILIESGNYSTGFWRNELCVDLERLQNDYTTAFYIIRDIHDTQGRSFREYYGIDICAKLPSGVDNEAIIDLCVDNYNRRDELTKGLSIDWVNGNYKAIWDNGDKKQPTYWDNFYQTVSELPCREVYDLSDSGNYPYVKDALEKEIYNDLPADATAHTIETWLAENGYYATDWECIYIGHSDFCKKFVDDRDGNDD